MQMHGKAAWTRALALLAAWTGARAAALRASVTRALAVALLAAWPAPGTALDFWDERIQIHGFYETQIRGIANDFDASDGWDLTQFAHVLNLELEADVAPDGFGPFDLVAAFVRVEVRYDCVWTHACGLFPSVNAYGDGAKRLPKRNFQGRRAGFLGGVETRDTRRFRGELPEQARWIYRDVPRLSRRPYGIEGTEAFGTLFTSPGLDGVLFTEDDPSPFYFDRYFTPNSRRCKFSSLRTKGPEDGVGQLNLGPLDPACEVEPIAGFIDKPNPFRSRDISPLTGSGGFGALPYRPAPEVGWQSNNPDWVPRGLWIPNAELREMLEDDDLDDPPINFSQNELSWNRGASQQDEKELKEAYVDLELFDSRLWLRLGKQTIVWGKTELFRNQDQFNPQDLALSSLPGLEESRTPLWAARAVWSFYDVWKLQDVRLELAVNYDEFEPNDLGDCGEPYAVSLVCAGTFGFLAHGFEALGLAGVKNPPDPWDSWSGLEAGARLEFRWSRFSFAISDFYGYSDLPTVERLFTFERNVDPESGRPRRLDSRGKCRTGREPDCLQGGRDALLYSALNHSLFAKNCAATFGFISLDTSACGLSIFNSKARTIDDPTDPNYASAPRLTVAFGNILSGQGVGGLFFTNGGAVFEGLGGFNENTLMQLARFEWTNPYVSQPDGALNFCRTAFASNARLNGLCPTPLVPLSLDDNDGGPAVLRGDEVGDNTFFFWILSGLQPFLTDEQEALLGCGPFYGTRCDVEGFDLLNAEASALFQSFVGFDGTFGDWDTTNRRVAQPGTVGFQGGPVCTRFERGRTFILPGCRGRGDPGYDARVDGTVDGPSFTPVGEPLVTGPRRHPFTGQPFRSEMSVLSWNLMMTLVGFSLPDDPKRPKGDEFDPNLPLRTNGCSFAKPQFCKSYIDFWRSIATTRNVVRAGGNGRFGRRDFIWAHGSPIYLRYEKRNVLGFSVDFAEDVTKSNWGIEATWLANVPFGDANEYDGLTRVDTYNVTISADRPTFVNFLNANRTFFFNGQIFVQYIDGYERSFGANGPWNFLATFTVTTGYFQDRLLPQATVVWDLQSDSGAFLPQVQYRYTENFSVAFGANLFAGRTQKKTMSINPIASRNRTGRGAYKDFVDNGLSVLRDRDELFLKLRYTF